MVNDIEHRAEKLPGCRGYSYILLASVKVELAMSQITRSAEDSGL